MKAYRNKAVLLSFFSFFVISQSRGHEKASEFFSGKIIFPEGYPEKENAVVYIEGLDLKKYPIKTHTKIIDQKDMRFIPFLTVTTVGSKIVFRNLDPHLHTVKAETGPLNKMKLAMTPVKNKFDRVVTVSGASELLCDIHSQMRAFLFVSPTNYFAVSGSNGLFAFSESLPKFPYEIKVWHEVLPEVVIPIRNEEDLNKAKEISLKTWEQAAR